MIIKKDKNKKEMSIPSISFHLENTHLCDLNHFIQSSYMFISNPVKIVDTVTAAIYNISATTTKKNNQQIVVVDV